MKNFRSILVMSLLALSVAGCGIGKMVKKYPEVEIKLENQDLENKGGKVDYTIKGTVPPKYLKKKAAIEIDVPYLVYEQENGQQATKKIGTITLVGEKSKVNGTVINYKQGGTFTKSGSFDYDEDYMNAEIHAVSTISMGKNSQTMLPRLLGEGIYNTSSLIGLHPEIVETDADGKITGNGTFLLHAPHQYKPEFITQTAIIYFEVNRYDLNWNLKLNKDQNAKNNIKEFVDFLYQGRVIDRVIVYGWASPEGEESRNQGLSEKRFEQGKKWFTQQFDKYLNDYAKKNNIRPRDLKKPELVFENHANGEDWGGFEAAVERSNIAEKNQILNVVRSQPNSALREQKIREMTDIYNEIAEVILPPLRRSEISVIANKNNFNDEQILALVVSNPDTLSINEKLYAASMIEDAARKEAIYRAIIADEVTQNEWRAYNNLAVINLNTFLATNQRSALSEATSNLNKALAVSPNNGIILNNLAIAHFLSGDNTTAKTRFEESQRAALYPIAQGYNLGMYKILEGDYSGAKNMMNNKHCDYNVALAQLVSKEYDAARTTLNCIPNQTGTVLYLKAILGARTQNQGEVFSNLRLAIEKDPSLKAKAKKDSEFKRYRKNAEFENIVR